MSSQTIPEEHPAIELHSHFGAINCSRYGNEWEDWVNTCYRGIWDGLINDLHRSSAWIWSTIRQCLPLYQMYALIPPPPLAAGLPLRTSGALPIGVGGYVVCQSSKRHRLDCLTLLDSQSHRSAASLNSSTALCRSSSVSAIVL